MDRAAGAIQFMTEHPSIHDVITSTHGEANSFFINSVMKNELHLAVCELSYDMNCLKA